MAERRPPSELKILTDRLAELLDSSGGARATALLQLLSARPQAVPRPTSGENASGPPRELGIWDYELRDGEPMFVRSAAKKATWVHWADVERISVRPRGRRVVLVGESVARGHFYDPHYTPAEVLRSLLSSVDGLEDLEVVDLARLGAPLSSIGKTVRASLALSPDAVVVFAGNNWFHSILSKPNDGVGLKHRLLEYELAAALRSGGFMAVKTLIDAEVRGAVSSLLQECARCSVPLLFVLPEFNLIDWRPDGRLQRLPWLPGRAVGEWLASHERASRAYASGAYEQATQHAERMVTLDGGLAASSSYLLAQCKLKAGANDEARRLFEQARDAALIDPEISSPRIYSSTQQVIRAKAGANGIHLVDLPVVFNEHLMGAMPDRRLFLDYSHLTVEGIQVAMAATASRLARVLRSVEIPWRVLKDRLAAPANEVQADAHLLATIHNAHLGQTEEICLHHSRQAIALNPSLAASMHDILDAFVRRAPTRVCASFRRVCEASKARSVSRIAATHGGKVMEVVLQRTFTQALAERGVDVAGQVAQLLLREHRLTARKTDLLQSYYAATFIGSDTTGRAYYRAWEQTSRFYFVSSDASSVQVDLTYRLPFPTLPRASVTMLVNGHELCELDPKQEWDSASVILPREHVRVGLNQIELRWPSPEIEGELQVCADAERLELGLGCEVFCWFGEVHTLVASATPGTADLLESR